MKKEQEYILEKGSKYGSGLDLKNLETVLPSAGLHRVAGKGGKKHG